MPLQESGRTRVWKYSSASESTFEYTDGRKHEPGTNLNKGGFGRPIRLCWVFF